MGEKPTRPIKVMHIIARMNVGGPAVEITELMRGLDPSIVSQRLVTGYCSDDEADFLETQAPDICATRIDGLGRSIRPTDDARALATLVRIIRASRPDIVHTHTAKAGVLGRIAAKTAGTGTRIVHTYHGHLLHGYFGSAKTWGVIQLERSLARITDRVICVGDKVKDDLLNAGIGGPHQYTVIRSGVRLGSLPDKSATRRELGLRDDVVIVSMIGRLSKIKRPDRFADVVEITKRRGAGVHYLIAGGGEEENYLRERVEREALPVTFLGWRSDIESILAVTDIVLLTSDNEGTPLSLIESAFAGIPVVSTRVGSVPEIVEDRITGLLCEASAVDLADAIITLSTNSKLRLSLGNAARNAAIKNRSERSFTGRHEKVYNLLYFLSAAGQASCTPVM